MRRANFFAVALLLALLAGRIPAQEVDPETVDRLTARALKHLTTMSRFAYKAGTYGDLEFGKNFGYSTVECYFGETTGLVHSTEVRTDRKTEKEFGVWMNGDQLIFTKKGDKGGTVISHHYVAWTKELDADQFAWFYSAMGLGYFVLPASADKYGRSRNPYSLPRRERANPPVTTITEATHRGRPCFHVVITPQEANTRLFAKPIVTEYYLDKDHGMVLTKRQKGMLHLPKGSRSPRFLDVDQLTEITYGPPTENGLPFPETVKGWFVWPTGRREPMTDVTFTEFRRYTPTADELDFEKQFGIPLPALPPKPARPPSIGGVRVTRWLVGGLVVTAFAAAVVYVRHRRAARRAQPATGGANGAV